MNTNLRRAARFAGNLVFAEPVINAVVKQHATAVGADADPWLFSHSSPG